MSELKIEVDALMNDEKFIAAATRMQVQMDRLDTLSQKTGLSKSALNKALAAEEKALNSSSTAMQKSTMSITDFRSAYQIAMDVVRVGQQVYAQTINVAQQYDQTILDVMISTGANADAASRMVQVVDDAGVSYSTLKTALKMASKEGIEPNIESLAELSDIFLKLKPGVERNQFLMDKFGKSGMDMQRAMLLGGDALRKMSAEMEGGLVLTQDNIDASEEWRKNLDELDDTVNGLKISVGNKLIPVLNDLVPALEKSSDEVKEQVKWWEYIVPPIGAAHAAIIGLTNYQDEKAIGVTDSATKSYEAMAQSMTEVTTASEDVTRSYDDQFSLIMKISDAYGMSAEKHSEMTRKILLDMTLQKIAMSDGEAGFSEAEMNKALAVAETAGAVEAAAIRELVAMEGISTAIANGTIAAQDMKGILESLTTHGWTVQVAIQMQNLENLRNILASNAAANPGRTYNAPGRAAGGSVTGGEMYMVGERGPELFAPKSNGTIIPNDKLNQPSAPQLTERGIAKAIVGEMLKHGAFSTGR